MLKKTLLVSLATLTFGGCQTAQTQPKGPTPEAEILNRLATYAQKASESSQRLALMRGANESVKLEDIDIPEGLDVPISINWNGPVENLVKKIAEWTGYGFEGTTGTRPLDGVPVKISVTNMKAFNILLDVAGQSGSAADIIVRPDARTLVIKYPPTIRNGSMPTTK